MKHLSAIERLARASLTDAECPPTEELAGYALAMLEANDELRVARHVRSCPLCQQLIADCRLPAPTVAPNRSRLQRLIAHLVPDPLAGGLRGGAARLHQYVAADFTVELTIGPPDGDAWPLAGQILSQSEALSDCAVKLAAPRQRARVGRSDAAGFFSFPRLPGGSYRLTITIDRRQIVIDDLLVGDEG